MNVKSERGHAYALAALLILFFIYPCTLSPLSYTSGGDIPIKDSRNSDQDLSIICINVSRGDSTLIISPTGTTMLIDTGQTGDAVLETLKEKGISNIDYLVSTHYDSDHIGGVDRIIMGDDWEYGTADDISIGVALDRGNDSMGSNTYIDDYLYSLDTIGCLRHEPAVGDVIDLGGGVEAICVCINGIVLGGNTTGWDLSENARSLGYLISFGTFEFLVCGDLLWYVEDILGLALYGTEIDILHLNHHGSKSSTSWEFVEAIWPENAVVSVGSSNSYGHPHQEVIDNLNYVEGPNGEHWFENVYITERGSGNVTSDNLITVHGDIEIITDGKEYSIDGDEFPTDELDSDGDGMPDVWETNMGLDPDFPMDAQGDRDGDGLLELEECQWWTSPLSDDTDEDGITDGWEVVYGLDPTVDDASYDNDGDGLTNLYEYNAGTDPIAEDTDNDGLDDREEIFDYGTSPLGNDTDGDGLTDLMEVRTYGTNPLSNDTDRDGISDRSELRKYGTDPADPDTDDDTMPDGWELAYGLDPLSPEDADGDADGDNITNLDEYLGGTEPCSSNNSHDINWSHPDDDPGDDDDVGQAGNTTAEADESEEQVDRIIFYIIIGVIVLFSLLMVLFFIRGTEGE